MQSRILQIAVDPNEYTAEVYTHEKQLRATLTLGEGRQRFDADEDASSSEMADEAMLQQASAQLQDMKRQMEQQEQREQDMKRQMEQQEQDMKWQMEQVQQDMKRQMEQMQEDMKRQPPDEV
jgi:hypothetical protein